MFSLYLGGTSSIGGTKNILCINCIKKLYNRTSRIVDDRSFEWKESRPSNYYVYTKSIDIPHKYAKLQTKAAKPKTKKMYRNKPKRSPLQKCRSSFKLLEMDDRFRFLSPGQHAVDCGAAPGSWSQVLVHRTNSLGVDPSKPIGRVIAIDRLPIYPIDGATIFSNMDFTLPSTQARVMEALDGDKVDIIVSDMAPNATGVKGMDHENIIMLAYSALRFAVQVSRIDAAILLKIWDGGDSNALESDLAKFYRKVKSVKPAASRTDSSEKFLLARGFRGLKT